MVPSFVASLSQGLRRKNYYWDLSQNNEFARSHCQLKHRHILLKDSSTALYIHAFKYLVLPSSRDKLPDSTNQQFR